MLALCVGVDYWYFTAADAGLLWEEREPALFVYCSDLEAVSYTPLTLPTIQL